MSHILEFLDLVDVPDDYSTAAGYTVAVNSAADALEFVLGVNANAIQGADVQSGTPSDGQVLLYDGVTDNRWELTTPPWLNKAGGTMTGFITLHNVPTSAMHAANKGYIDDNFSASSHGHDDDEIALSGTHTELLSGASHVDDAMTVLDDLDDDDIPLTSSYLNILLGATSVGGALDIVDALDFWQLNDVHLGLSSPADKAIIAWDNGDSRWEERTLNDDLVPMSGTPYASDGWLSGLSTVGAAMDLLDSFNSGFTSSTAQFSPGAFITFDDGKGTTDKQIMYIDVSGSYVAFGQQAPSTAALDEIQMWSPTTWLNDTAIQVQDSFGTARNVATISAVDLLTLGYTGGDMTIASTLNTLYIDRFASVIWGNSAGTASLTMLATDTSDNLEIGEDATGILMMQNATFENADGVWGEETGGTNRQMLAMDASDQVVLGNSSNVTVLQSSGWITAYGPLVVDDYIRLANDSYLYSRDNAGTGTVALIKANSSDIVIVGDPNENMYLYADAVVWCIGATLRLDNNYSVSGREVGGTSRHMLYMSTGDDITLGNSTNDLVFGSKASSDLSFLNTKGIRGLETDSTSRVMLRLASGDDIQVGNASNQLTLFADGEIDCSDNDLVDVAEIDAHRHQATITKTMNDGTSTEFARTYLQASAPSKTTAVFYYEIEATNLTDTDIQCESGWVTLSMVRDSSGTNTAATSVKAGTVNVVSSGTLTCAFSTGNAGSDHQRCRCIVTSSFGTATITGKFIAVGNADSTLTWS